MILSTNDMEDFLVKTKQFFQASKLEFIDNIDQKNQLLRETNNRLENNYEDLLLSIQVRI